jgi:hypothetical protein
MFVTNAILQRTYPTFILINKTGYSPLYIIMLYGKNPDKMQERLREKAKRAVTSPHSLYSFLKMLVFHITLILYN